LVVNAAALPTRAVILCIVFEKDIMVIFDKTVGKNDQPVGKIIFSCIMLANHISISYEIA